MTKQASRPERARHGLPVVAQPRPPPPPSTHLPVKHAHRRPHCRRKSRARGRQPKVRGGPGAACGRAREGPCRAARLGAQRHGQRPRGRARACLTREPRGGPPGPREADGTGGASRSRCHASAARQATSVVRIDIAPFQRLIAGYLIGTASRQRSQNNTRGALLAVQLPICDFVQDATVSPLSPGHSPANFARLRTPVPLFQQPVRLAAPRRGR